MSDEIQVGISPDKEITLLIPWQEGTISLTLLTEQARAMGEALIELSHNPEVIANEQISGSH